MINTIKMKKVKTDLFLICFLDKYNETKYILI